MSRKRQHKHSQPKPAPGSKRVAAVMCLVLALLMSGGILAQRGVVLRRQAGAVAAVPGALPAAGASSAASPSPSQQAGGLVAQSASSPSKEYIYAGGKLIATEEGAVSPPPPPTSAPIALTVLITSSSGVTLNWTYSGSGQSGFKAERKLATDASFTIVGTVSGFSFVDAGLRAGVAYTYQVVAFNPNGDSAASNAVTVTLPSAAPAAPTNMAGHRNDPGGLHGRNILEQPRRVDQPHGYGYRQRPCESQRGAGHVRSGR
jgi:hypothetical protein